MTDYNKNNISNNHNKKKLMILIVRKYNLNLYILLIEIKNNHKIKYNHKLNVKIKQRKMNKKITKNAVLF